MYKNRNYSGAGGTPPLNVKRGLGGVKKNETHPTSHNPP